MRININDVKLQRAAFHAEAEELINAARDQHRDLSAQESAKFEGLTYKIDFLEKQIKEHNAGAHFGDHVVPAGGTQHQPPAVAARRQMPSGQSGQAGQAGSALRALYTQSPEARADIDSLAGFLTGRQINGAATLTPAGDGGVLIPSSVAGAIVADYLALHPMLDVARVVSTEDGAPFTYPVLSDSETAVAIASAANTGADDVVSGDTPPTELTGPTLNAYKASSKPVFVPRELAVDGAVDIIGAVLGALVARLTRYENTKFTTGNGTTEQQGFLTAATAYPTSGSLTLDMALDLAYSVSALYRPQGKFMCSDATAKYLRLLKTGIAGDQRQLWADANATLGTPATLHGYPVVINDDMPSVTATGTFTGGELAFGDFSKVVIRRADSGVPYLYKYPVPARDGSAVIAFSRSDSKLLVPAAISKLTLAS